MSLKSFFINQITRGYWIDGSIAPDRVDEERWQDQLIPGTMQNKFKYVLNRLSYDDTYLLIPIHGNGENHYSIYQPYLDQWEALKPLIKDWIIYEGPIAYNAIHKERDFPSIQLVIIEKPRDFKEFEL